MRRGFKEEAKQLALEVRQELGLDAFAPVDPLDLATDYGIPVYLLSELGRFGGSDAALAYFRDAATATLVSSPKARTRAGTITTPPPMPTTAPSHPAPRPSTASQSASGTPTCWWRTTAASPAGRKVPICVH